jgi:DNA-binding response OmpR family regulator
METTPVLLPPVLIFETDPPTAELYRRALSYDYHVITCSNEASLREMLDTQELCAAILEPAALGDRAWEMLAQIEQIAAVKRLPIIICTTLDERKRGLQLGAAAYLVKPVLPGALIDALRKVTTHGGARA